MLAPALERTVGLVTLVAILTTLVMIVGFSLWVRRGEIEWQGPLPVSLLAFVGWAGLSILWSDYQWATLGGIAYLVAFLVLGVGIALTRDTIQIVRSFGDVMRFVLVLSLSVEVLAGAIIDSALPFLGVQGNLPALGPLQGVMGSRNQFALVALLALVTFGIEFATKSVTRGVAIASVSVAVLSLALSRSPVVGAVLVVVIAAAGALAVIRRAPPERRTVWQLAIVVAALVLAVVAWLSRARIIEIFSANSELTYRIQVWQRAWDLIDLSPLEGSGWIGAWQPDLPPFSYFASAGVREPASALNAYLDVWLQLGLVGVFAFGVLVVLAFTRSWLLAGRHRSIAQSWSALVLLVLTVTSLAESSMLVEYGWMLLVVCAVGAARQLSWRTAFAPPLLPPE